MNLTEDKVISKEKINKSTISLKSVFDDYFGLLVLVIMLIILGVSFVFFLYPKLTQIEDYITETKMKLEDDRIQIDRYRKAIIKYNETFAKISDEEKVKLNSMIAPDQEFNSIYNADLIISVRDLLSREGFFITEMDVVNTGDDKNGNKRSVIKSAAAGDEDMIPEGVDVVNVDMSFENLPYDKFKELLSLLENKLRLIDVVEVDYISTDEEANLSFNTYVFSE